MCNQAKEDRNVAKPKISKKAAKADLIDFIQYKVGDEFAEFNKTYRFSKMSYDRLKIWAIRNDIIDA